MIKTTFLSLLFLTLLNVSCGSKEEEQSSENATDKGSKNVQLILEFKTTVNDKFKIYYSKNPNTEIGGELFIDKYIYGDDDMQKATFNFPKGDLPYKIRLDVGTNQKVENITIKNISIAYGDKTLSGDEGEFMKFWSPNECIKFDDVNYLYTLVPSTNGIKTPVFMANIELQKKLRSLFK